MRKNLLAAMAIIASGCSGTAESQGGYVRNDGARLPDVDECSVGEAEKLVGKMQSEALGKEALRLAGAKTLRWVRPGQAVTMDFSPSRINLELDRDGRVVGVTCG